MVSKLRGRPSWMFLLALVALFVGLSFLVRKVGAQAGDKRPVPIKVGIRPVPSASALPAPAPEPKVDGKGEGKKDDKDSKKDDYEEPIDYADAPKEGGVPIHKEGPYKSPFAHPHFGGPAKVKVGMLLTNVREYDIQKGTFEADFFMTFTSDKPMPPMDPIFTNGKMDSKEVMADKPTFKMYRFIGTFSSPPDLHGYPFDTQELVIEVEDDDNGTDQVVLETDQEHTNLDVGFDVPGWETAFTKARILTHYFPDRFEHDDLYYSRFEFVLGLRRYSTSAIFTVFIPAIVIVLISLTGLWFPRDELEVRSNATTPMLAAAVLFHYSLTQAIPATGYLTRADKLMMAVYAILGFHMLITWVWFLFHEDHTARIFAWGKWIGVPVTFAILACGILL